MSYPSALPSHFVSPFATSRITGLVGQATRPEEYPNEILWNLNDCQKYSGLITESNQSRPAMDRCIRHTNGQEISAAEYRSIKTSVRMLVNIHLATLALPSDPAAKNQPKTKSYYKKYYPQNWRDVLAKVEEQEPLVALCAAHWKADHIVGNCLRAIADAEKLARRKGGFSDDDEEISTETQPENPKKRRDNVTEESRRKKKQKSSAVQGIFVDTSSDTETCDLIILIEPSTSRSATRTPLNEQLANLGNKWTTEAHVATPALEPPQHLASSLGAATANKNSAPGPAPALTPRSPPLRSIDVSFIYIDIACKSCKIATTYSISNSNCLA